MHIFIEVANTMKKELLKDLNIILDKVTKQEKM
jgi:hypothetical protein